MIVTPLNYNDILKSLIDDDIIIIPIFSDENKHVYNNSLSLIYIKYIKTNDILILPINHNECINISTEMSIHILNSITSLKYIADKKSFINVLSSFNDFGCIDILSLYYINNNKSIENKYNSWFLEHQTLSERHIKNNFSVADINSYVPIYKIIDKCNKISNELIEIINTNCMSANDREYFLFLDKTIKEFSILEKNGLHVTDKLLKYHPSYNIHINDDNLIYSKYNIYTMTGRPSNTFDKLNFAALNKETGIRSVFTSRFGDDGILLMLDYDAYHLNLIADVVGYKFPTDISIHTYLGKLYHGKNELTDDEYNQSKEMSFTLLYGGFDKSIGDIIPFFGKVYTFIENIWNQYNTYGYVESPISKKRFYSKNFSDMNKNKLFNYLLQEMETSRNIFVMEKLQSLLSTMNSKLVLYLYDAFIFDVNINDGQNLIQCIRDIMEDSGKYKTKLYFGNNLHDMEKIT